MNLLVFIVTSRRPELLEKCIRSVALALPPTGACRILVNGYCERTETLLAQWKDPRFSWEVISRQPRAGARNRAFFVRGADLVYFLDDDVEVPCHLFRKALAEFESDTQLAVLGGPNLTPPESSWWERLFGVVLCSAFAAPFIRTRYQARETLQKNRATERDLILCNLAVRRSLLPSDLFFEDEMRSGEENLFLSVCQKARLRMRFNGALWVHHHRRKNIAGFLKQIHASGYGRGQQFRKEPAGSHPAFLAPAIAVLTAIASIAGGRVDFLEILLGAHFAGSFLGAVFSKDIRRQGAGMILPVALLTVLIHGVYGIGLLRGFSRRASARPASAAALASVFD